ncbi:MAG: MmcQ/YjbR family DNA-binding protein [Ilumatobacteraceae bacterium]
MATTPLNAVRKIALSLPETTERLSHGSPTWFIRDKKTFVTYHENHHGDGNGYAIWCAAPPGVQEQMIEAEPERYYRPAYVGHRGWIGLRLDIDRDDEEIAAVITEAYRCVAPKTLVKQLDE